MLYALICGISRILDVAAGIRDACSVKLGSVNHHCRGYLGDGLQRR